MPVTVDFEKEVALDKIIDVFDVRVIAGAADQPRVELLSGLYKDGKVVDLIEVTPMDTNGKYRLVEGRTRYAALKQNKVKSTRVSVLSPATDAEYIEYAYNQNCSGPKPPGLDDLKKTIELLQQKGLTPKQILTGPLSKTESQHRLKLACDQVRSNLAKKGVAKAKVMINQLAIADPEERIRIAAKACNVQVRALKKALNSMPGTKKNTLLNEVKKDLGRHHNRERTWVNDWVLRIERRHDDGTPTSEAFQVFDHIIKQFISNLEVMEGAKKRFEQRVNGGKTKAAVSGA